MKVWVDFRVYSRQAHGTLLRLFYCLHFCILHPLISNNVLPLLSVLSDMVPSGNTNVPNEAYKQTMPKTDSRGLLGAYLWLLAYFSFCTHKISHHQFPFLSVLVNIDMNPSVAPPDAANEPLRLIDTNS